MWETISSSMTPRFPAYLLASRRNLPSSERWSTIAAVGAQFDNGTPLFPLIWTNDLFVPASLQAVFRFPPESTVTDKLTTDGEHEAPNLAICLLTRVLKRHDGAVFPQPYWSVGFSKPTHDVLKQNSFILFFLWKNY